MYQTKSLINRVKRILSRKLSQISISYKQYDQKKVLKCSVSYNRYGGYCVPESSRHRPAAQKILTNDIYELETIQFIESNCKFGDIIHAGTYFGDFLPALSQACCNNSKIWAFEPNLENFRCAKITIQINNLNNVKLVNAGLGKHNKKLPMQTHDKYEKALGGGSKIITNDVENISGKIEMVKMVTIDDFIEKDRNINIIHLDVEGHEKEALIGAIKTIQRCLPIIIVEALPNSVLQNDSWLKENILSLDYRLLDTINRNLIYINKSKKSTGFNKQNINLK
jgi:FkbM family methyltransferase|tara:strand:+ start:265 stop:1107 length:843 start_codon:yes stop_codon:yes gene_type:complete